jgi:putative DNA primase/helicase
MYAEAADVTDDRKREAFLKFIGRSLTRRGINAVLGISRDLEGVTISADSLDADPYLLNVDNGYVDLRTGDLYKHDPACLMTRLIPWGYEPKATAPLWDAFLEKVLPNEDTRNYVHRWIGYSATGSIKERRLAIWYGIGRNGKTTLREVIDDILGDHTRVGPKELLVGRKDGTIPTDLAGLKGKRSVTVSESDKGQPLNSALVKQMTGGDTVTARFMRQDFFDFVPTFKLTMLTNYKPKADSDDPAIWDRIDLVGLREEKKPGFP